MTFRVMEAFCLGKWADDRCEDVIHQSDGFVAVIDGATSMHAGPGKTPARLMAELIDEALHRVQAEAHADEALRFINAHIRACLGYADDADVLRRGSRPAAAALIFSRAQDEVWCIGDGWLVRDGKPERLEIGFAEPYTYLRCAYVDAQLRTGACIDDLRASSADWEVIRPFLELQPGIQNNAAAGRYAYGVIDGSDGCLPFVSIFDVKDTADLVLASDGYPVVGQNLAMTERLLAQVIEDDPLMIGVYPQCKPVRPGQVSFDDRSFVHLVREAAAGAE